MIKKIDKNFFLNLKKVFIIAEIGVNHNGDVNLAIKMIDVAKKIGADAVKFQTFSAESLASLKTPKVHYQKNSTPSDESFFDMIKKLELSYEDHILLNKYCSKVGIIFLSTPYDVESAKFLNEKLNVRFFKTSSADITDYYLHEYIASTQKPSIISTGMATLGEIEEVIEIYRRNKSSNLILLHCVSNYPCSDQSLNLNVLSTLIQAFQLPVGFSDHSIGYEAAILSIGLGAKIIEKHLTLDKNLPGPDHVASSTPKEFSDLIKAVRRSEIILGSPVKICQPEEIEMAGISRKSIVLVKSIKKGDTLDKSYLTLRRPGTGLHPREMTKFFNKKVNKNIKEGEHITYRDIE